MANLAIIYFISFQFDVYFEAIIRRRREAVAYFYGYRLLSIQGRFESHIRLAFRPRTVN